MIYEDIYHPKSKAEFAELLAKRFQYKEAEKQEYKGKPIEKVYWNLRAQFMKKNLSVLKGTYYNAFKKKINKKEDLNPEKLVQDIQDNISMLERCCIDAQNETELGEANKIQPILDHIENDLSGLKFAHEVYFHKYRYLFEEIKQKYSL